MSLQSDYLEHLPGFAAILDRQGRYLWLSPGGPSDWLGQTDIDLQPEALAEIIGRNNHDFWVAPMTTQHQESRAFNGAQETWFVTRKRSVLQTPTR